MVADDQVWNIQLFNMVYSNGHTIWVDKRRNNIRVCMPNNDRRLRRAIEFAGD